MTRAVFSPGGEVLATASLDRTLRLWRVEHDLPLGVIELKDNNASEIFFHPNGLLVLAAVAAQVRIWDTASRQEVSPKLKGFANVGWDSGLRFDERGRFSVGYRWGVWNRSTYDLTPDERPARDLVALCQLYAGERLDESDGLVPLGRQEIEAMWNALSARYPEDFRAPAAAAVEWRLAPLETFDEKSPAQIALLRRWLAAELEESGWKPGEKGNESLVRGSYLERLWALAENGRHEEATAAALALVGRWPDAAQSCACVFALASRAVKTDAALAERYAVRAVALLRQAAAIADDAGKKEVLDAPDLDALRAEQISARWSAVTRDRESLRKTRGLRSRLTFLPMGVLRAPSAGKTAARSRSGQARRRVQTRRIVPPAARPRSGQVLRPRQSRPAIGRGRARLPANVRLASRSMKFALCESSQPHENPAARRDAATGWPSAPPSEKRISISSRVLVGPGLRGPL